jgi:anaerobic selenocysteine-containing dehydrogenase
MVKVKKTVCGLCAVQNCGMNVYVENKRVVKIEGMLENPFNSGMLCPKALAAKDLPADPKRLISPLKRTGERGEGKWKSISWDEALDTIAEKFAEIKNYDGPEAVAFTRGSGAGWNSNWDYLQRFIHAFGSPNVATNINVCYGPRVGPYRFTWGGVPAPDWENTKCMVLWAFNPFETYSGNYSSRIMDAKERGAKLIVIDPRFTPTASKADIFVAPRPGTDGALALSLAHVIIKEGLHDEEFIGEFVYGFEEFTRLVEDYPPEKVEKITQVPSATIRDVARIYATTKPGILRDGNGIDQMTNAVQTARAIQALSVITGNIAIKGGLVIMPGLPIPDLAMRGMWKEKLADKSVSKHPLFHLVWSITDPDLWDAILTDKPYPIKALFIIGHAPRVLNSEADVIVEKVLKKVPFLVVHDLYMTEEAKMADIVLPAASFLECTRLRITRYQIAAHLQHLCLQNRTIEPPGEARCDEEVVYALATRLGLDEHFPWKNVDEFINALIEPLGITVDDLRKDPGGFVRAYSPKDLYREYTAYKEKGFNTPSKKVELYSPTFKKFGYDPIPEYIEPMESPLSKPDLAKEFPLIGDAGVKTILYTHSQERTWPLLTSIMPEPWVGINPKKADELGINDGDTVLVESPRGGVKLKAKVTEAINDPDTVFLTYGWGQSYGGDWPIVNNITPGMDRCPISTSTSNHTFLCRIKKV